MISVLLFINWIKLTMTRRYYNGPSIYYSFGTFTFQVNSTSSACFNTRTTFHADTDINSI